MKQDTTPFRSYATGFIWSLILTVTAAALVAMHIYFGHNIISHQTLIPSIFALAALQAIIQLACFLQLGSGKRQGWKLGVFISTAGLIVIIVIGSIWIMDHLNYHMAPDQINHYLQDQGGGF